MCPDIIETKLLNQREREWKPDPQVINKWTVLYNLQKDYMDRILPQIESTKKYDDIIHQKIAKEKIEKQNLANLIQFQNKVNSDLSNKSERSKFDSDNENCDDEDLKYKHNKVVGARKTQLTDFNKLLVKEVQNNKNLHDITKNILDPSNKSILQESMKNFFTKKNSFNFKERQGGNIQKLIAENLYVDDKEIINKKSNDAALKLNVDSDSIISDVKLRQGENTEINFSKTKLFSNAGQRKSKLKTSTEKRENEADIKINKNLTSDQRIKETKTISNTKKLENRSEKPSNTSISLEPSLIQKSEKIIKPLHNQVNKFDSKSEPVLDENLELLENKRILNPPIFSSFLETTQPVNIDKSFFLSKSNFNLETQRRGRRRSRFPDPQWDCAEAQIAKLVRYLCEEELSSSYQKYCKPIFQQINTMIESFLYHDNNLEICQNLHMCPVTVDI